MKTFTVYIATSPSGKKYVGKTVNFKSRIREHRYNARRGVQTRFHTALRKYGDEMKFEEYFVSFSEPYSFEIETALIAELKTMDKAHGYNLTNGGEGTTGVVVSEETRRKLSIAAKNIPTASRKAQGDAIRGEKHPLWGKPRSAELRAKLSRAMSGEKHPNFGKILSAEIRTKISETRKKNYRAPAIPRKGPESQPSRVSIRDSNGNEYASQSIASRATGINLNSVRASLMAPGKLVNGTAFYFSDPNYKITPGPKNIVRLKDQHGREYDSATQAAKIIGISRIVIYLHLKGEKSHVRGLMLTRI